MTLILEYNVNNPFCCLQWIYGNSAPKYALENIAVSPNMYFMSTPPTHESLPADDDVLKRGDFISIVQY